MLLFTLFCTTMGMCQMIVFKQNLTKYEFEGSITSVWKGAK